MNAYVIIGIVIVAIGTLVMVYGTHHASTQQSNSSSAAIQKQFDELAQKVQSLGAEEDVSPEEKKALENEFDRLAAEFERVRPELQLDYRKRLLAAEESALSLGTRWSRIYESFLQRLRDALTAYKRRGQGNITFDIPRLPGNIASSDARSYEGSVRLSDDEAWTIKLAGSVENIPYLQIELPRKQSTTSGLLDIGPDFDDEKIVLGRRGVFALHLDGFADEYSLEEFERVTDHMIQKLIEYEIVRTESSASQ